MSNARHSWSDKVVISPNKSERVCLHCGMVKATRHEVEGGHARHWQEFYRGLDRIECDGTPVCQPELAS